MTMVKIAIWVVAAVLIYEFPGKDLWSRVYFARQADKYVDLVVACQTTMHVWETLFVDLPDDPTQGELEAVSQAEREMSICHQHDVMRKRLLINGVSEPRIQSLGLRAFEDQRVPFEVFIRPHKMLGGEM